MVGILLHSSGGRLVLPLQIIYDERGVNGIFKSRLAIRILSPQMIGRDKFVWLVA